MADCGLIVKTGFITNVCVKLFDTMRILNSPSKFRRFRKRVKRVIYFASWHGRIAFIYFVSLKNDLYLSRCRVFQRFWLGSKTERVKGFDIDHLSGNIEGRHTEFQDHEGNWHVVETTPLLNKEGRLLV